MDPIIECYFSGLVVGELQTFENMGIVPLFPSTNGGPVYTPLKEALDERLITITEVGQSGSVPELRVVNTSPSPVLLIDGEELIGAKQNRVLNTTILLGANSETIIPVSCTEQGRWRYSSRTSYDSGVIMFQRGRASKTRSVTQSLQADRGFAADQPQVWADVGESLDDSRTSSPTRAMKDMFTAKSRKLNKYGKAFECLPHQQGSLVFVNGEPVGFDVISREEPYAKLHPKLVKSYAMDALLQQEDRFNEPTVDKARAFLKEAQECGDSKFPSVGQGFDYRFDGERMVGSALVFEKSVIHLAFFRLDKVRRDEHMSGYRQRRGFRRRRT